MLVSRWAADSSLFFLCVSCGDNSNITASSANSEGRIGCPAFREVRRVITRDGRNFVYSLTRKAFCLVAGDLENALYRPRFVVTVQSPNPEEETKYCQPVSIQNTAGR